MKNIRKPYYRFFCLLFAVPVLFLAATACSSDDDNPPPPPPVAECKIITLMIKNGNNAPESFNVSYNNDGKISNVTHPNGKLTFTYGTQGIVQNVFNSNDELTRTSTIELNARELAEKITLDNYDPNNQTITSTTVLLYEYNSQDEMIKEIRKTDNDPEVTTILTWSGGNMVQLTDGVNTLNLGYFTDQPIQQGDYLQIFYNIEYGVPIYNNKNLLKSIEQEQSGDIQNFNYEYDADGKITKFVVNSTNNPNNLEASYQYLCE